MNPGFEAPKPEIFIYYVKNAVPKDVINEVSLGIEEEGLPFQCFSIEAQEPETATHLGYKAAEKSRLGVGIGIDSKEVVMHFNKLKEDEPLFKIDVGSDEEKLRAIGANAARIVKRMPFKPLNN